MKTKSALKTAAKPLPSPEATLQANIRANLPDVNTAAQLAATLAAGRPIDKASAGDVAGQAIDLWQAAKRAIGERFAETLVANHKSHQWARTFDGVVMGVAVPLRWEDFGKLLLPRSKVEDRAKLLRDFRNSTSDLPELLAADRIETDFDYYELAIRFLEWRGRNAKAKAILKASNAAKKSAGRRNPKPALDTISPAQKVTQAPRPSP